jgi:hypothetical protein
VSVANEAEHHDADREIDPLLANQAAEEHDPGRLIESSPNSRLGLCLVQARICKEGMSHDSAS